MDELPRFVQCTLVVVKGPLEYEYRDAEYEYEYGHDDEAEIQATTKG